MYREPGGPGVRVDSGVAEGSEISPLYDPMIAKLIVRGADREDAIGRMLRALGEFEIGGVKTLIGFHKALLSHPCFRAGETCHGIVESELLALRAEELSDEPSRDGAPVGGRTVERTMFAEVDGRRVEVKVHVPEPPYRELARRRRERTAAGRAGGASDRVVEPDAGNGAAGAGGRRRRGRSRSGDLHRRGDEDGERGDRPSLRRCQRPVDRGGSAGDDRPGDLHDRTAAARGSADTRGTCASPTPP